LFAAKWDLLLTTTTIYNSYLKNRLSVFIEARYISLLGNRNLLDIFSTLSFLFLIMVNIIFFVIGYLNIVIQKFKKIAHIQWWLTLNLIGMTTI
jgi:hypothetical protein